MGHLFEPFKEKQADST